MTLRPVSVLAAGAAAPVLRLPLSEVSGAWGTGASKGQVALCDADEDTLTLAWRAATDALAAAGVSASDVSGLWWGTTRPPFAEGPSHIFLATALGLDPSSGGALLAGSPHSGMEALFGAWDALAAGSAELALVVASDALVPGLGTAGESTTGAGAAALVLAMEQSDGRRGARLVARATRSLPSVDRYRADTASSTGDAYDARLFREEVFIPLMTGAAKGAGSEPSVWVVSDPDGKLAVPLAKRLGAPVASAPVQSAFGDTGSAAPFLGLLFASGSPEMSSGGVLGVLGYGGGRASAVTVETQGAIPGASDISELLSAGTQVTYARALRARGQLEPMADPIPMGLPPAGAAFSRGNVEMLQLEGARCADCGVISTPPSVHPTCTGCGSSHLGTVRLARNGTVFTFVVNQTMPPPFAAPLPLVVVDLDDGARLMLQGTPEDADRLGVGDAVTLSLRRYALERGIPVYGYKVSRTASADEASGPSRLRVSEEVR